MNSIKNSKKSQEKKDESLIDKLNDSNSKSLLKNSMGEFGITLFPKQSNRRTKLGGDLTAAYTAKFFTNKDNFKKNRTLTYGEDKKDSSNASETESSLKNLEHKFSKRSRGWDESIKSKSTEKVEKTIVDNIENIYSQIKKIPIKLRLQNLLIYLIAILTGIFEWSFLFQLTDNKLERNYCFTNLYQFDSCSLEQICKNYKKKINFIIYNNTIDVHSRNKEDNRFIEENNIINNYYKQFFLKYSHILSTNQLLNSYQIFSSNKDKGNYAIILTYKQQWNIFLRYFFACQKKNILLLILIMYIFGGFFGSIILGFQADIRGRKKILQIALIITLFGYGIFVLYFFCLDDYYKKYKRYFRENYSYSNENNIEYNNILGDIYSQNMLRTLVNKTYIIYLFGVFITNFGSYPLLKVSLSLLLENSTSERIVLKNYRKYNFFFRGCSPILTSFILVNLNSVTFSYILLFFSNLILCILSFFILNESMRYLYEYCEWKSLSEFIDKTFILEEEKDIQFLDNNELKHFQAEENEIINKEYEIRRLNLKAENENDDIFEKNNFYNYYKRKKSFLIRNIRRKTDVITKYIEISYNPSIIIICLRANRHFIKSRYLLFSILLLIHFFLYILQQEMIKKPFFRERDLYFSFGNNFILNTNFFLLLIVSFISNYFYFYLFRISCYKIVIVFSSTILSFLSFIYYIHSINSKKTPLYYNEYNFGMLDLYYRDMYILNELYLHGMYFALNGICFYIHLLVIKMSKTIYRCSFFCLHSLTVLVSLIITEIFKTEIKKPFLLLGFINLLCLLLILFLKEMNELPNLVNDLKQNVEKKVKHEKSE